MILTGENKSTGNKVSSSATWPTTIPTRNGLHLNGTFAVIDGKVMV